MKHKLLALITILLISALFAGCMATPPTAPVTAPAESAAQVENGCAAGFRPIDHDYGTTCVPENPQRIAVTDIDIAAFMRVLGIQPVALDFAQWNELVNASPEWGEAGAAFTADAVDLGEWPYNLEVLAAAQPDLILAAGVEDYDLLNEIAPTVAFNIYDNNQDRWSTFTEFFGNVLNTGDETQALIDVTDERIAALSNYLQTEGGNPTVSVFASPDGNIYYGAPYFAYNQVLAQAGVARPAAQAVTQAEYDTLFDIYWATVSLEELDTLDADYLLMLDYGNPDAVAGLQDEPIWQALQAVQNEHFFTAPGQQWLSFDIYSINKTIDNLFTIVGGVDPATVAPNPFLTDGATVPSTGSGSAAVESAGMACEAGFRAIVGAFGATCIPVAPERVIAMNESVMANLLALGVTPIGVQDWTRRDFTQYLGDTTAAIPSVGATDGPNYEAMLALDPDLILAMESDVDEASLALLQQVAPVAVSTVTNVDWRGNLLFAGDVVGKVDVAEALVEQTDARLAEFRTAYEAQAPADETIAIIRSRADSFNIYWTDSFISDLTTEAGLQMPAAFNELTERSLSLEAIPLLTSDKLFVMVRNEQESGMFSEMAGNALWATLPAAQNGEVYVVNWSVWVAGWNIIGTNLVIDDLYYYLLDAEPTTPNPFADLIIPDFGPQYDEVRLGIE